MASDRKVVKRTHTIYLVIITCVKCDGVISKLGLRDKMSFHYHNLWAAVPLSTPFTGFFSFFFAKKTLM